jgi:hypothetical protein
LSASSQHDSVKNQLTNVRDMLAALGAAHEIDDLAALAEPNEQPPEQEAVELKAAEERQVDEAVRGQPSDA